jgi:hypothetical protein
VEAICEWKCVHEGVGDSGWYASCGGVQVD